MIAATQSDIGLEKGALSVRILRTYSTLRGMPNFCHLHCHTSYSLLDGAAGIPALTERASELGIRALGITDHGNLYGVPEFHAKVRNAGMHPVIGCEFYLAPGSRLDRRDRRRFHQVLWAKNKTGYRNLSALSSLSFKEGFYYKPRIDRELLEKYHDGLVASTCCLQGEVPQTILKDSEEAAFAVFKQYLEIFGEDYYIELQNHSIEEQQRVNAVLLRWARDCNVRVVATNDVHYVRQSEAAAQDILLCLQTGKSLDDPQRMRFENDQFYLKSGNEMLQAMEAIDPVIAEEALATSIEIADKCQVELTTAGLLMPHFTIPGNFKGDGDAYLRHLVFTGAQSRYDELSREVTSRLENELGVIAKMGYAGYFLVVQDFTRAARKLGVAVGAGRGSAAGSAVAYCLGITNIDPFRYNLLFERFLNPERISMPDIDIDFDDRGRSAVIDYVVKKYGRDNVCQIITFGTMGARSVIRDVARVLKISFAESDRIAKLIPDGPGVTLASAMEAVPEFKALESNSRSEIQDLLRYARVLEGCTRHTGVHAAGVIIAPGTVSDYVPVATTKNKDDQVLTTQYDGTWVERFGLLKMDFLGLSTLTVLKDATARVAEHRGQQVVLDEIPLDDDNTFTLFQRGDTLGVFQFESDGMREWLTKLEPSNINDLIAMNALYRPGPMDLIPRYVDRKHGREEITYWHPMLEPVLRDTYGIPVYQEQVMQMAQVMAGYTLGSADLLRRAMGKKKQKEMNLQRDKFVRGAGERGVDAATANEVFDVMAKFAGYGFNKCLAGCTEVMDHVTGRVYSLESLFLNPPETLLLDALGADGTLYPRKVLDIVWNGYRQVFELSTASGRRIRATATHRFRVRNGWKRLAELRIGEDVAISGDQEDTAGNVAVATRTILWDPVIQIVEGGRSDTYDLAMEDDHNFVANGVIVHNSHSAAYSLIAYHAAYFKANYTEEFMAAAMTNAMSDSKKLAVMLDEARRLNLRLLPPSVNRSEPHFTVEDNCVRFGMCAVKGVGHSAADAIVRVRKEHGDASTLFGLARHLDLKVVNKQVMESLARVGALDELEGHRAQLVNGVETARDFAHREQEDAVKGQSSLFAEFDAADPETLGSEPALPMAEEWSRARILKEEKELLGLYVSGHPLNAFRPEVRAFANASLDSANLTTDSSGYGNQQTFCGILSAVKPKVTRKGASMATATLEDFTGQGEVVFFSEVYDRVRQYLKENEIVMVRGQAEPRGGLLRILAREVIPMQKVRSSMVKAIIVRINSPAVELNHMDAFRKICDANSGRCQLFFDLEDRNLPSGRQRLRSRTFSVNPSAELMAGIASIFGTDNIVVEGTD